jgi:hypothetical protein
VVHEAEPGRSRSYLCWQAVSVCVPTYLSTESPCITPGTPSLHRLPICNPWGAYYHQRRLDWNPRGVGYLRMAYVRALSLILPHPTPAASLSGAGQDRGSDDADHAP